MNVTITQEIHLINYHYNDTITILAYLVITPFTGEFFQADDGQVIKNMARKCYFFVQHTYSNEPFIKVVFINQFEIVCFLNLFNFGLFLFYFYFCSSKDVSHKTASIILL